MVVQLHVLWPIHPRERQDEIEDGGERGREESPGRTRGRLQEHNAGGSKPADSHLGKGCRGIPETLRDAQFTECGALFGVLHQTSRRLLSTKLCWGESQSSFKARFEHRLQLRQNVSDAVSSNSPFAVF